MNLANKDVAVNFVASRSYPSRIPFHPHERFPEYPGSGTDPGNRVYGEVRETLQMLGLDKENFGTGRWNPFRGIVKPGMTVFVKPNTVRHHHLGNKDIFSVITHASILRPVLDYICIALENRGRIIIGDSQVIFGRFDKAMAISQIEGLLEWYRKQTPVPIECFDLRIVRGTRTWMYGKWGRKKVEQDPRGYMVVDLGNRSCFNGIDPRRLRVAIASYKNMYKFHSDGKHQYVFPGSVLASDAIINIAKLKTHRRTAVTLAIKNFMGLPALKDCLPHFITGSVEEGGDQYIYPSRRKAICLRLHDEIQANPWVPVKFACAVLKKIVWNTHKIFPFKDDIYEAMWYGNDTLWRTLIDLNRIAFYADKNGIVREEPQRKCFALIDGIIGGEKDGPVSPDPVPAGVLLAGHNSVAMDAVGATLMGFDVDKIPMIRNAFCGNGTPLPLFVGGKEEIRVIDKKGVFGLEEYKKVRNLGFEPHPNWKEHVEL
ncbi:MAG: hypothetical protein Kow00128_11930 [Deltaproteobacteria bacterium]